MQAMLAQGLRLASRACDLCEWPPGRRGATIATMLRKILLVLLAVVLLVVLVGLALPTAFVLERSVVVEAPPAKIHAFVGDLRRWPEWTVWQESSPEMRIELGPTTTGVGASQRWTDPTGAGRLVFTRCDEAGVAYDMSFVDDGEEMPAKGAIDYAVEGRATRVTWSMSGDFAVPVVGGWLRLVMLGLIAEDFDKGLAKLKRAAEAT